MGYHFNSKHESMFDFILIDDFISINDFIAKKARKLINEIQGYSFDYYDPDASYEDDWKAFYHAFELQIK